MKSKFVDEFKDIKNWLAGGLVVAGFPINNETFEYFSHASAQYLLVRAALYTFKDFNKVMQYAAAFTTAVAVSVGWEELQNFFPHSYIGGDCGWRDPTIGAMGAAAALLANYWENRQRTKQIL